MEAQAHLERLLISLALEITCRQYVTRLTPCRRELRLSWNLDSYIMKRPFRDIKERMRRLSCPTIICCLDRRRYPTLSLEKLLRVQDILVILSK